MSYPGPQAPQPEPGSQGSRVPAVDPKILWAGGVATAVVAALIAVIGRLIAQDLLDIPVIYPRGGFVYDNTTTLAAYAAGCAIIATALLHLLLVSTPTAASFFNWICTLATIVAVVLTLTQGGTIESRVASAVIYLVIGIAVTTLLDGVAGSAKRRGRA